MSYTTQKTLPTAQEIHKKFPLTDDLSKQIDQDREEIQDILSGKDDRKILIVGPCSAWPSEAVLEYVKELAPLKEQVKDKIKLVMRVYIQKPRTTIGWTGPVNQPDPYAESDVEAGLEYCRPMMLDVIAEGFAIADEALFTHKQGYFTDLYSWIAIGARSTEDQEHRIFASMVDCPVGMKNPTSGNIPIGVNSILAAQNKHTFVINGEQIKTSGNPYAHLILRGGDGKPNCDLENLKLSAEILDKKGVENPAIIVDISHDNSIDPSTGKKDPILQPQILNQVISDMKSDEKLSKSIKGFMIESFLKDGGQNMNNFSDASELEYGKSITDGCLGIEKTKAMILDLAGKV